MNSNLHIEKKKKWKSLVEEYFKIHFIGKAFNTTANKLLNFRSIAKYLYVNNDDKKIAEYLYEIDGHFSFIYSDKHKTIATIDWIRSYPIFYSIDETNRLSISNDALILKKTICANRVDNTAAIDIFASGYATGNRTIFQEIKQIMPGNFLIMNKNKLLIKNYKGFFPNGIGYRKSSIKILKKKFIESVDKVFSRLTEVYKGRLFLVPLSAGIDSRLVLSALIRHGHRDIQCYSYGLKNNSEIEVAKKICDKVNIKWKQIITSPKIIRNFSKSEFYLNYMEYSDSLASVPFIQDLPAIYLYKEKYSIPEDSVFINGNSGDFISGGHIPKNLFNKIKIKEYDLIDLIIKKHFCLWDRCLSDRYYSKISHNLKNLIHQHKKCFQSNMPAAVYETLEWAERQSKFVVSGQRVYDYIDMDWCLPLWEDPFKDFFENLDYKYKYNQNFYRDTLIQLDWSKIWKNTPINEKKIFPIWIRPVRFFLKSLHYPLGKKSWYQFEKKYINYFTNYISSEALVSYFDKNKFKDSYRNGVSLRSINYLKKHGIKCL